MKKILIALFGLLIVPTGAMAVACDANSEYVSSEYALCSTHAHNIGLGGNDMDGEQLAMMNETVRLKSTLIAQEMKRQYDLLNVTMRQFRVQLQKAVLYPGDNTGGGGGGPLSSGYASGGGAGGDNADGLTDAEDCGGKMPGETAECIYRNLTVITGATENGTRITAAAQKQIAIYVSLANGMQRGTIKIELGGNCPTRLTNNNLAGCINALRSQIGNYITASQSSGGGAGAAR